ncbi:cytochrome P450 [Streptomyces morookaense]|uniref:Cytochrome P450 n=1 Tax=Streptomyces morookaense TaxID=1970 RepID=A0A7Y7E9A6_STRMO|nr:cytochrome P450 [Streptomyces morookaense]NVK80222.1 cytochrome P450 [Streptomyces morookaense]GHF40523.1 cytochrome P450 [Streptomyces morookaense]
MTREPQPQPPGIAVPEDFWRHLPFDVRGEAFRADPYPFYELLRAEGPVASLADGVLVVTGYHAATAILGDPSFGLGAGALESQSFLLVDPPEHRRRRARVGGPFSARAVERLRPAIRHRTGELVCAAAARGEAEAVSELALPLALELICALVGVPMDDRPRWYGPLVGLTGGFDPPALRDEENTARLATARLDFAHYLGELVEERRRVPRDDLVSALVAPGPDGTALTGPEIVTALGQLVIAGFEPTVHLMANGLHALLRHPAQFARLQADPSCAPDVVEEVLRYDPTVQIMTRIALRDTDAVGRHVPAGTVVGILPGAANRDPEVFPDPHRLDVTRAPQHLALGRGEHFCLGAGLVRAQAQALLTDLARCRPALTGEPVRYRDTVMLRGVERLPVVLTERPEADG